MQAVFRIDGYDNFEQVGVGGMAVVYKARRLSIKKTVAIKVLQPHLAQNETYVARFQQEAEVAARVQHPNIVNVIDYGVSDGSYYIVMEYYEGRNLESLINEHSPIPIDICYAVLMNACQGLEAAHAESLVHRDIKPANIIYTHQGGIKIADFGLAKDTESFQVMTHSGKVVGTPAYMSPEQARGEAVDTQSDIFSLGVVAFELLSGRRPFGGSSFAEVVDAIQNREIPSLSDTNPLVDPAFADIVAHMLDREKGDRYAHISEVIMDLEDAIDSTDQRFSNRTLAAYLRDPTGYRRKIDDVMLESLRANEPTGDRNTRLRHYRKRLYLDPSDTGAKQAIHEIEMGIDDASAPVARVALDDDALCRVFLEAIDTSVETPDTFALKLSMRIKTPLPRARAFVRRMPCQIAGNMPYATARKLIKVLEELGGTARYEAVAEKPPPTKPEPPPAEPGGEIIEAPYQGNNEAQAGEGADGSAETPPTARRPGSGLIVCPSCGWEEHPDARFCSLCRESFNKTEKIDVREALGKWDNPLEEKTAASPLQSLMAQVQALPVSLKITAAALLLLIVISIFSR